jgi:hypothetical protein
MRKLGLCLILILIFPAFSTLIPKVNAAPGTLVITVLNYDGTPAFFLPGTTTVNVLTTSGTTVGSQNIDSNSRATFNLNEGPYNVEIFHASGLGLGINEFWGRATDYLVFPGIATGYEFTRSAPIFQSVQYSNPNPVVGQPVTVSLTVRNIDPFASHRCSVRLFLDRDQVSPYDINQTSTQTTILAGNSYIFRFTFLSLVAGTYYADAVLTAVYGSSFLTDQLVWGNPLPVVLPVLIDQTLSSSTALPGQSLVVGYHVSNPSGSSVNVGLGFSIRMSGTTSEIYDPVGDKIFSLSPGSSWYFRNFTVPFTAAPGSYETTWGIWPGLPRTGTPLQTTGWLSGFLTIVGVASVVFSATGLGSSTTGTILTVDGLQYASLPQFFSWAVGSSHSYTWGSYVNDAASGTRQYEWQSCSGLASVQTGTLSVPSSGGSVAASYATNYQVVFAVNPPGGGSSVPSGVQWCRAGSDLSIVAQPESGYSFQNWSISGLSPISVVNSSSASTSATVNGAGTVTANFLPSVIPEFGPWAMLFVLMASTASLSAMMKRKNKNRKSQS